MEIHFQKGQRGENKREKEMAKGLGVSVDKVRHMCKAEMQARAME